MQLLRSVQKYVQRFNDRLGRIVVIYFSKSLGNPQLIFSGYLLGTWQNAVSIAKSVYKRDCL